MRAAYHDGPGGFDVLQVGEVPDAVAGPAEVLVRARATSLDRVDLYFREGSHGLRPVGRHIGGRDVAGTVEAIGEAATAAHPELRVGDEVVAVAVRSAHAELVPVPGAWVFPLPPGCDAIEAAAVPTAGRSAYDALVNRAGLRSGEDVLVFAAGSGVGSFGIQIARALGCRVLATVGSPWKVEPALALGADAVLDHHGDELAARVRELTDGEGVHVVLDHLGAPVLEAALDSLRRFGRYVTTGVTGGHRASLHLGKVFERGLTVTGVGRPDEAAVRSVMEGLLAMVARGQVRPAVHAVLPLEQVAAGHELLDSSAVFGKVVLTL